MKRIISNLTLLFFSFFVCFEALAMEQYRRGPNGEMIPIENKPSNPTEQIIRDSNGELIFPKITFGHADDNKTVAKNIWTEYIDEEKNGVKIYRSNLHFRSMKDDYKKILEELFFQAKSDNIEYFFLTKFGRISIDDFSDAVFKTFKEFVDGNPSSNLKLILIGYEEEAFTSFANKLDVREYESYRERVRVHQNNIVDILHNLHFNGAYGPISAVFSPCEGVLSNAINGVQRYASTLKEPTTKVNLEWLITTSQQKCGQGVGSAMALSTTHTLAKFLSISPKMPEWPVLKLVDYELTISNITRINSDFNQVLASFIKGNLVRIPLIQLPDLLQKINFPSTVREIPSGIYLILHSTQLGTSKAKYKALSNFLLGPEQSSPGQDMVFIDFISNRVAKNPVLNAAGVTFEREVLETWLKYTHVDPISHYKGGNDYKFIEKQVTKEQVDNVHKTLIAENLDSADIEDLSRTLTSMLESFKKVPDRNLYSFLDTIKATLKEKFGNNASIRSIVLEITKLHNSSFVDQTDSNFVVSRQDGTPEFF